MGKRKEFFAVAWQLEMYKMSGRHMERKLKAITTDGQKWTVIAKVSRIPVSSTEGGGEIDGCTEYFLYPSMERLNKTGESEVSTIDGKLVLTLIS